MRPAAKRLQYLLYRNSHTPDSWFTHHHFGIDGNAVKKFVLHIAHLLSIEYNVSNLS